jgi:murein DD-endopeptidase MepM/ murein hydrolase activator NlpD
VLLHYGKNILANKVEIDSDCISIGTDVGTPVKAVFEGEVVMIDNYDDRQLIVIKHGKYFTGYSNVSGSGLKKGQQVAVGQIIGRVAANLEGVGAVDFRISNDKSEQNPESWLKRK